MHCYLLLKIFHLFCSLFFLSLFLFFTFKLWGKKNGKTEKNDLFFTLKKVDETKEVKKIKNKTQQNKNPNTLLRLKDTHTSKKKHIRKDRTTDSPTR